MPNQSPLASVERVAEQLAQEMGYEWISLELVKEPAGRFLRFIVDKDGGISLDELEIYHKKIQPFAEHIEYDYMEVSSPGLDRPIKNARDFARAKGRKVEVKLYKPLNGLKTHIGILKDYTQTDVAIETDAGEARFSHKAVALIKPVLEFTDADFEGDADLTLTDGDE